MRSYLYGRAGCLNKHTASSWNVLDTLSNVIICNNLSATRRFRYVPGPSMRFHEVLWDCMRFCRIPSGSMRFLTHNTNFGRHQNTCSGAISIKISIGIIRNHLPDTLSPFLELPRPWLWGAALLKLPCNGIFSFGVLSTGHLSQHHLISPTPTPTPALPTLEATQLHQFEPFLLGFLVSWFLLFSQRPTR
jgi:hypothetical protein